MPTGREHESHATATDERSQGSSQEAAGCPCLLAARRPRSQVCAPCSRGGQLAGVTDRTVMASIRELDETARMWAAILHCGAQGNLGGRNALVLHGWRGDLESPFDVVVPSTTQPPKSKDWLRIRRLMSHREVGTSPPRVPVHDAVVQAVGWARSDREGMYILLCTATTTRDARQGYRERAREQPAPPAHPGNGWRVPQRDPEP